MAAVITGFLKRSFFLISYFQLLGNIVSSWVITFPCYHLQLLSHFLLTSHSSEMAFLHDCLGLWANRSSFFQVPFLNKIFQEYGLHLQKIKIHSFKCIFLFRQCLCKLLDRFNQPFHEETIFTLKLISEAQLLLLVFFFFSLHI